MSKQTVLYMDPDDDSRYIHQQLLEIFGFRAVCAATVAQGLELAREEGPAVVITELFGHPPDGFGVIRSLKGDERTHSIPIVVLSAWVMPDHREGALEAGAAVFLSKPCEAGTLQRVLERITGRGRRPTARSASPTAADGD
jgi:CheY-like chemotaxis protein